MTDQDKPSTEADQEEQKRVEQRDFDLFALARRHMPSLETLATRGSDSLDFHEVAVWTLRDMLAQAYERGRAEGAAPLEAKVTALKGHLVAIRHIAESSGEWKGVHDDASYGFDCDRPDEGAYDADDPPDGYDETGWDGNGVVPEPEQPLQPVIWGDYTTDELRFRVFNIATSASEVLKEFGAVKPRDKQEPVARDATWG